MDITSYYRNILSTSYMVRVEFGGGETRYAQSESDIDSLHTPKLPEETIVKVLNGISSKEVRNAIEKEESIDLLLVPRTLQAQVNPKAPPGRP